METNIVLLLLGTIVICVPGNRLKRSCSIDLCQQNMCRNGGTCQQHPTNCFQVTCLCPNGYSGDICELETSSENGTDSTEECKDACADESPCFNGGTCIWDATACVKSCKCPPDFNGTLCELGSRCPGLDFCNYLPCKNGGKCKRNEDCGYLCVCKEGFSGDHCQIPVRAEPCGNLTCMHGRCVRDNVCQCDEYFAGIECSEDCLLDCRTGICVLNDEGKAICDCDPPFYGPRCRSVSTTPETMGSHRCQLHGILLIFVFVFIFCDVT